MTDEEQYQAGRRITEILLEYGASFNQALEVYATLMGWIGYREGVKPKELGLYVGAVAHEIEKSVKEREGAAS